MVNQKNPLLSENRTLKNQKSSSRGQTLIQWSSPAWVFRKRSREFYTTIAALIFLLSVIFFLLGWEMLILVMLALAFFVYVLSTIPPAKVEHRITTFGVETVNRLYPWWQLHEFWFDKKHESDILVIQTYLPFPGRVHILVGDIDKQEIKNILQDYLPYRQAPIKSFVDKAADWLNRKILLETATQ